MYDYDDYPEPRFWLPLLLAITIHGLAVVALIYYDTPEKPKPKITVIEASVMTAKESARLQSASAQQKVASSVSSSTSSAKTHNNRPAPTTNTPTAPSSQLSEYNKRLAERERAFEQELASYTASLDRQIALNIEQRKQAEREIDEARQREVDALKGRAKSSDEIAQENIQAMKELAERTKTKQNNESTKTSLSTESQSLAQEHTPPNVPNVGRGGQVGSTSNVSKNEAQSNIAGRVQAIWERYKNPKNRHLTATITIDDNGNLLSVSFGAGDKDLQPSLEASIREASPFPEMKGISRSFSIRFYTD